MNLSDSDKLIINKILAAEPGIELAYLYGSYATGLAYAESDVDIGILWKKEVPDGRWTAEVDITLKLKEALSKECDVRTINDAPIYFLDQVVNFGLVLFASSDMVRTEFEARIIMDYLDYKPVFDLYNSYRDKRLERGEFGVKYRRNISQDR
jgi:predicted nucleotidyltransferase